MADTYIAFVTGQKRKNMEDDSSLHNDTTAISSILDSSMGQRSKRYQVSVNSPYAQMPGTSSDMPSVFMSSVEMSSYNYSRTATRTPHNNPTGYKARPNTPAMSGHHDNDVTMVEQPVVYRKKGKSSQCRHRRRHRHSSHVPGLLTSTPTKDDVVTTTIYNIDDMSSITFQNTRCVSDMGQQNSRYGPMHSTIKLGHQPSTSSPIRERRKRCSKHRSTGGPVLRLDFTDLNNTADSEVLSPGLKVLQSSKLRQVINDKIMSVFNFNDLDDSMDTQVGSLRGSSSSESLSEQQRPTINQLGNGLHGNNFPVPVTSYNIVVSKETESSDIVSNSDNNQVSSSESSDSAYTSDYYPEENRRRSVHNISMESDMTDFMVKPMHKEAVVAKHCTEGKPKKKTLMSKLKSFGKHFYGRKCDQIQTLAVL